MENYEELIKSADVILVEFYATWCPHCKRMMPIVDKVREQVAGRAGIHQLDIDENDELAGKMGVDGVPAFLLYKRGELVWTYSGEISGEDLLRRIESQF